MHVNLLKGEKWYSRIHPIATIQL